MEILKTNRNSEFSSSPKVPQKAVQKLMEIGFMKDVELNKDNESSRFPVLKSQKSVIALFV